MPHFAVDETAYAHPKVVRAGNAAIGLWARLGSYACNHLTDGLIPHEIAAMYGTGPQIRKLLTFRLLHASGHDCPRCRQPDPGDYVMHDYLTPNPSRAQVAQRRERAAEKKRQQRATAAGPERNRGGIEDDSLSIRRGIDDENTAIQTPLFGETPGHNSVSPGDSSQTRARPRPLPNPPSPTEKEGKTASYASQTPNAAPHGLSHIGDRPRIPDTSQPLVNALTTAGLVVGWDLQSGDWFVIDALIKRCGIPALLTSANASWQGARTQPRSAAYFLPAWRALPSAPAEPATHNGQIVPLQAARPLTGTDARFAEHTALTARLRTQEAQDTP